MKTHSGILTWEIPWTQEPSGLQPMGLQTVGPDLVMFSLSIDYVPYQKPFLL